VPVYRKRDPDHEIRCCVRSPDHETGETPVQKHLVTIQSNAVTGREADYEDWCNNVHVDEGQRLNGGETADDCLLF
jgi:hypothetical protein